MPTFNGWLVGKALNPNKVQAAGRPPFSIKF